MVEAAKFTEIVAGKVVRCFDADQGRYRRTPAVCVAGDTELGALTVWSGLALAYLEYGQEYVRHKAAATESRRRQWAGEFVALWDWLSGKRALSVIAESVSGGCKG